MKLLAQQAAGWTAYIGSIALGLLAIAIVAIPVGTVVVDYWKPMVVASKSAAIEIGPAARKGR